MIFTIDNIKGLLKDLVDRWILELQNNQMMLEENMPKELRQDMDDAIEMELSRARDALRWLDR